MTKTEAVASLRAHGFHAFEREWTLGETIGVASEPDAAHDGITVHGRVLYLVRRNDLWFVEESHLIPAEPYRSKCMTLDVAVDHARSLLSQPPGSL